ncbi:MAG: FecR domain-containing protein [Bacteroidota bacterium]
MIKQLLEKYKNGTCTPEELAQLEAYFQSNEEIEIREWLEDDFANNESVDVPPPTQKIWNRLEDSMKESTVSTRVVTRIMIIRRIAAAAVILLLISVGTWLFISENQAFSNTVVVNNYQLEPKKVELEDGSIVWLNQNSRISFSKDFIQEERVIKLKGEALFEVTKDSLHPFIVRSGEIATRVLGTIFNVKAFPKDSVVRIALVEGKVEVEGPDKKNTYKKEILAPHEQIAYYKQDTTYERAQFEQDQPYAWQKGIVYFDKADVEEVTRTLAKLYKVKFRIQEAEKINETIVYKLDAKKLNIDEVLRQITIISDYKFKRISKKRILVMPK